MKRISVFIIFLAVLLGAGLIVRNKFTLPKSNPDSGSTITSTVRFVNSTVSADGSVTAQSQARLSFQTSGKLIYLPFKEGDRVRASQTIARLDTYALQRQLTLALNSYRTTRDTFDQTQANSQDNLLKSQISPVYINAQMDNTTAVNDALRRILDQSQAGLDNSVINVELANYALQLSALTSPLNGIVTHEDVTVPGINITPATGFTVADPDTMVFRANVPAGNIYYVTPGNSVTLAVDGIKNMITGTVVKIYPSKVILGSGQAVYQVDIESIALKQNAKLDQTGKAIISTNSENVALVPAWTVLNGKYIWINNNGTPELKQVSIGKIHGNEIEITAGLSAGDKIITNPRYIPSLKYPLL
jgi:RND family efflux transporter MFP subunit